MGATFGKRLSKRQKDDNLDILRLHERNQSTPSEYHPIQMSIAHLELTDKAFTKNLPQPAQGASDTGSVIHPMPIPQQASILSKTNRERRRCLLKEQMRKNNQSKESVKESKHLSEVRPSVIVTKTEEPEQQLLIQKSSQLIQQLPTPSPKRVLQPSSPSKKNLLIYRSSQNTGIINGIIGSASLQRDSFVVGTKLASKPFLATAQPQTSHGPRDHDNLKIPLPESVTPRIQTTGHPGFRIVAALPAFRASAQTIHLSEYSAKNSTASPRSMISHSMLLHSPKFNSTFHRAQGSIANLQQNTEQIQEELQNFSDFDKKITAQNAAVAGSISPTSGETKLVSSGRNKSRGRVPRKVAERKNIPMSQQLQHRPIYQLSKLGTLEKITSVKQQEFQQLSPTVNYTDLVLTQQRQNRIMTQGGTISGEVQGMKFNNTLSQHFLKMGNTFSTLSSNKDTHLSGQNIVALSQQSQRPADPGKTKKYPQMNRLKLPVDTLSNHAYFGVRALSTSSYSPSATYPHSPTQSQIALIPQSAQSTSNRAFEFTLDMTSPQTATHKLRPTLGNQTVNFMKSRMLSQNQLTQQSARSSARNPVGTFDSVERLNTAATPRQHMESTMIQQPLNHVSFQDKRKMKYRDLLSTLFTTRKKDPNFQDLTKPLIVFDPKAPPITQAPSNQVKDRPIQSRQLSRGVLRQRRKMLIKLDGAGGVAGSPQSHKGRLSSFQSMNQDIISISGLNMSPPV
ncbi:hypothetical protein FGO68_gene2218 [Halteria grandinella]|uniref:Uncharacterized protein n=1 Tax=Halteria grandinella TaxID=5974 RepID=A0A8J8NXJ3_HALGN|nr:hypothetical protein FGO68_gene2218 [Halteria grandinella]